MPVLEGGQSGAVPNQVKRQSSCIPQKRAATQKGLFDRFVLLAFDRKRSVFFVPIQNCGRVRNRVEFDESSQASQITVLAWPEPHSRPVGRV